MIKKLNLILIGIGLTLTVNYNIGYVIYIPIAIFYLRKDIKNIFYLIPPGICATLLFRFDTLIPFLITLTLLILFFILINLLKIKEIFKLIIISVFIVLVNLLNFFLLKLDYTILNYILFFITSVLIFLFLSFEDYIYLNNIIKNPTLYADHLVIIASILGYLTVKVYGINLGFILTGYFVFYFSRYYHNIYALLLNVILFFILYLGFDINESILILLIGAIYFFDYSYLFFLVNVILVIILYTTKIYQESYLYTLMVLSIIFEILYSILTRKSTISKMTVPYMYNLEKTSVANEYLAFANFLDFFTLTFKNTKEYSLQLNKAMECIMERHCKICNKQSECFKKFKSNLAFEFKNIIENNDIQADFKKFCPSLKGIKETSIMLNKQMTKNTDERNSILLAILHDAKVVLEKYQKDINNKNMIDYKIIETFHNKLLDSMFVIKDIRYLKLYTTDFYIEVIVEKKEMNNYNELYTLINTSLLLPIKIKIKETDKEYIYIITLKEKFNIKYGYGSLSSKENELCGDNHYIKSYENGHFLAAISDGMGKGYKAFEDSRRVIDALDALCYCSTDVGTNVEILNLLYILQGYTERYSTLDAIDINRSNYNATIYKLGSSTSYIFHEDKTFTKYENKCLPLGIEEDIVKKEVTLRNNDVILITSDGIFENVLEETKLLEMINMIKNEDPEKIAYEILEYTLHTKVKTKDDMSIIILKIEGII